VWYRNISGTSISTAFAGGAAGLLLSAVPDAKAADIKEWILDGAKEIDALAPYFSNGVSSSFQSCLFPGNKSWLEVD